MIHVKMADGRLETFGGGTIKCDVAGGDLLLSRLEKVSKMATNPLTGALERVEMFEGTPIKVYARGQWHEVEYVEEPGDGLELTAPGAGEERKA